MNSNQKINSSIDQPFFAVIEDFINADTAHDLAFEILTRKEKDPRENYEFLGLGSGKAIEEDAPYPWDPDNVIKDTGIYAFNFFKNVYNLDENFVLDRIFGNIMNPGASLDVHRDLSYGKDQEHDFNKKTFVCGLFLSDTYEGGDLTFFETKNVSFKPKAGTLVLFNGHSTWHGVEKIIENSRINILYMYYYTDPESSL